MAWVIDRYIDLFTYYHSSPYTGPIHDRVHGIGSTLMIIRNRYLNNQG